MRVMLDEDRSRARLVLLLAFIAGCLGALALAGWALGRPLVDPAGDRRVPMAPSTALLVLLLAATLAPLAYGQCPARAPRALAFVAGAVSLALLAASLAGVRPGVEHLGFDVPEAGTGPALGHISPITAAALLLVALSLASSNSSGPSRWRERVAISSAGAAAAVALVLLVGYLFGEPLFHVGTFVPPAASTAVALLALGAAAVVLAVPGPSGAWREGPPRNALLLVYLAFATGVIAVALFSYRSFAGRFRKEAESRIASIADLKVSELTQYRRERLEDGALLFRNADFSRAVRQARAPSNDPFELAAWLDRLSASSTYAGVLLLDRDGSLETARPVGAPSLSDAGRAEALAALRDRRVVLQDLQKNVGDGRVYMGVLVPILDVERSDEPLGVLVLRIDPTGYLYPFVGRWPSPSETAETLLVRRDGGDALFLNPLRFRQDAALSLRVPLSGETPAAMAARGGTGVVRSRDYRGSPVLAAIRGIPGSPWYLVARIDQAEVDAPLRERLLVQTVLVIGLLAGGGGLAAAILRKRGLEALRKEIASERERTWLHELVAGSLSEVYVLESERAPFRFVNDGACRDLGYTRDELSALMPAQVLADLGDEGLRERLDVLRRGERDEVVLETAHLRKDGSRYPVELRLQKGLAPGGPVFLAFALDVTARKEAEAQLLKLNAELESRVEDRTRRLFEVNKELATFAYSVSHDLKAPLRAIDGYSRLLLEEKAAALDEEGQSFVRNVRQGAATMAQLIDDLLAYSRMERRAMEPESVSVRAVVSSVLAEQADAFRSSGARLEVDVPELVARADKTGLQLVLRNLLSNALKFRERGRTAVVEIGGDETEAACHLFVRDHGIGFDMKYHDRVFELFQRLGRSEEYPGTGLGLALVRRAMSRMGGRVWAESAPGHGATFHLELPR